MSAWLGVVSAAHVRRAQSLGIAQINHGSRAGLARMRAGDALVYYSPVEERGDTEPLRAFTAYGTIADDEITAVEVTPTATDPTVLDEQVRFAEDIGQIVVGVDIDAVEVGWVAGSSATPRGFNDALRQIKEQADEP